MYVTSRNLRAASGGAMPQAVKLVNYIIGLLNGNHGGQYGASIQVGGDPTAIGVLGRFETLGDYERMLLALSTDSDIQDAFQMADHLLAPGTVDTIWSIRLPPGEPSTYSTVTSSRIQLASINEAMAFAAEVSATVSRITDRPVGMATAATGDRSRLVWVSAFDSMSDMDGTTADLEADEAYLDLFKRSEGLLVPNSLESTIWRSTAA